MTKFESFVFFVNYGVNLSHFPDKKLLVFLPKTYWTTSSFLVERFQRSKARNLSKVIQNLHENFKN